MAELFSCASLAGISVLLTDECYKHTLGLTRHLGRRGAQVSLLAGSRRSLACTSRYCHQVILEGRDGVEAFLKAAYTAVTRDHYDILIPVGYSRTRALAQHKSQFLPHVHVELVDAETIELAANKVSMAQVAQKVGVPVPRYIVPEDRDQALHASETLSYPLVVKPQRESRGRSVSYARNSGELVDACSRFFAAASEPPLVQEYVPGEGCGFFATYQNGECKRVFMHRRVREYPASGGVSTCAESFYDARLEECGKRLLDALAWHGVAMAEFRRDARDGEFKLLEINPKFWGSLDLALAAGADFPGDLCRMACGEKLAFTDGYDRRLRFHWPFSISGELFHLRSRPASFLDVVRDCLNPRVKSNLSLDDVRPHLTELGDLGHVLAASAKG